MAPTIRTKGKPESGSRGWIRANTLCFLDTIVDDDDQLDRALAERGLCRAMLSRPDAVVSATQLALVLEILSERLRIPDLGMRLALRQCAEPLADPVELAIFNAPTLEDALLFGQRHVSYYSPAVRYVIERINSHGRVRLSYHYEAEGLHARQVTEYGCLRACMNVINLVDSRPSEVWFRHSRIAEQQVYDDRYNALVRFQMPCDAVFVDEADLAKSIVDRDPDLYELGKEISAKRQADAKPLSAHLHAEIERLLPIKKCSYDMVCEHIGLTPRTLRRYLALENTTFKHLKDSVRREKIEAALGFPGVRRSDLAHYAGYYDPASIRRNIRRWF